jgi:membrane fusion protein, heavy metal efflux system
MKASTFVVCAVYGALTLLTIACGASLKGHPDENGSTAPTKRSVLPDTDANHFKVDHAERFGLFIAQEYISTPELNVTGVVSPDVSRQVPVISLASGRIVEIDVRLGDTVQKGQLLFKVRSTDVAGAFSNYRQAVKNEELTKMQLNRAKLLYEDGAIPKSTLEIAQNAEDDNLVLLETAREQLGLLGLDPEHPTGIVHVYAPISGVITDQEVTNSAGVQALSAPSPLTISDLSHVWVMCDVYENDLGQVRLGEFADIRLVAYPDKLLKGHIGSIGPILDPNIRTAKVRLELANPGLMQLGMFVTATFHGAQRERHASVPAAAILHLHDREWVYTPDGNGFFQRREVVTGNMLPGNMQEVLSGIAPGVQVVSDALDLQHTVSE